MRSIQKLLLVVILLNSTYLHAGAVRVLEIISSKKQVIILQEKEREKRWKEKDLVCIVREEIERVCGHVDRANPYRVTVTFDRGITNSSWNALRAGGLDGFLEVVFGDVLAHHSIAIRTLASQERIKERTISSTPVSVSKDLIVNLAPQGRPEEGADPYEKTRNFMAGMTYLFPTFEYQQALGTHVGIGLKPQYMAATTPNGSMSGLGGFATINFYGSETFRGLLGQIGLGGFLMNGQTSAAEQNWIAPAGTFSVGWRFLWHSGFNFGLSVGAEYLARKPTAIDLGTSGFFPTAALDLGFAI